jgi:hypothetical protein
MNRTVGANLVFALASIAGKHRANTRFAPTLAIFTLVFIGAAPTSSAVKLTPHAASIDVTIDGKPFTAYRFDEKDDPQFARPYFFPVLAADGTPLTLDQGREPEGQPRNHNHHRSLYVAHCDVNGADHWYLRLKDKQPRQRHIAFDKLEGDTIVQRLAWESADRKSDVLNETRTLRFLALEDGVRGIDLTVALTPVDNQPVVLGDTEEAGFCSLRVAKAMSDTGTITNAEGKTGEKNTWGKPAKWCDISGTIDGKQYGIAVLDHPSNPRHPTRWHVRQYGLMCANPFGVHHFDLQNTPEGAGAMTLPPDKTTTFRYRVVIHPGSADQANLQQKFEAFAKD